MSNILSKTLIFLILIFISLVPSLCVDMTFTQMTAGETPSMNHAFTGSTGDDYGVGVVVANGRYFVAASYAGTGGTDERNVQLAAFNSDMSVAYSHQFGDAAKTDIPQDVIAIEDNIVVLVYSEVDQQSKLFYMSFDGNTFSNYEILTSGYHSKAFLKESIDSNFIIVGSKDDGGFVARVNDDRTIAWLSLGDPVTVLEYTDVVELDTTIFGAVGNEEGTCAFQSYLIGGTTHYYSYGLSYFGWKSQCFSINKATNGIIIAGWTTYCDSCSKDGLLIKLDLTGNSKWARNIGFDQDEEFKAVKELQNGMFMAVGYTSSKGTGNMEAWIAVMQDDGNLLDWITYGKPLDDYFNSFIIDANTFVVAIGAHQVSDVTALNSMLAYMHYCLPGQYYSSSYKCQDCPSGTYSDSFRTKTCPPCSDGQYQDLAGQNACRDCNPGYFADIGHTTCAPCPSGTYQSLSNQLECMPCKEGYYQNYMGQTECKKCPVGYYADVPYMSGCNKCPSGSYQSAEGQTACIECPRGYVQPLEGQDDCDKCPPGYYQSNTGQFSCEECPVGKYQDNEGEEFCKNCRVGQYQDVAGKIYCKDCPKGTYVDYEGAGSCYECKLGYYQDEIGQTSCKKCPVGTYSKVTGAYECEECDFGSYQDTEGQGFCKVCNGGTYSNTKRSTTCIDCPPGSFQFLTGKSSCSLCTAGYANNLAGKASCTKCLLGAFASGVGNTVCTKCPKGQYANSLGSTSCKLCSPGTVSAFEGLNFCSKCPIGSVQPDQGKESCYKCPIGTYASSAILCSPCPVGQYQDKPGYDQCKPCEINTYQDQTGKTSCINCPDGNYQDLTGQQSCKACHSLCKRCYGPSNFECTKCYWYILNVQHDIENACVCKDGYYFDPTQPSKSLYCKECSKFCKKCQDDPDNCLQCDDSPGLIMINHKCFCTNPGYFSYFNSTLDRYQCVSCHPLCESCTGPLATQCSSCIQAKNAIYKAPSTCDCEFGLYYDNIIQECRPCNQLCKSCIGPNSDQCIDCNYPSGIKLEDKPGYCVPFCEDGYYKNDKLCESIFLFLL